MEEVQTWKEALRKVADISGSEIGNKPQNEQIEKIVGIEDRVQDLRNILRFDFNDIRVVGISGMGGIGKTTLARALYERICHQYNYRCFIDDVSGMGGIGETTLAPTLYERICHDADIGNKPQNEQIENIVQEIINNLRPKILNLSRDELVGIEDRIRNLGNMLRFDLLDFRVVGISGMGGIGETTLARTLYERICHDADIGNKFLVITVKLPGRIDVEVKNHWYTTLEKRSHEEAFGKEETRASKSLKNKESMSNGVPVPFPASSHNSNDSEDISFSSLSSSSDEYSSGPCFP